MKKIYVISIGHKDYLTSDLTNALANLQEKLNDEYFFTKEIQTIVLDQDTAKLAVQRIKADNPLGILIIISSWLECKVIMTIIKEFETYPMILWGFPIINRDTVKLSSGSYVAAAMMNGVINRLGIKTEVLIGDWIDELIMRKILLFAKNTFSVNVLRNSNVGLIGYTAMSIYPGTFDHLLMRYIIGPEIEQIDTFTLLNESNNATEEELFLAENKLREMGVVNDNVEFSAMRKTMGIYVAAKKLCEKHNWMAINIKCQYELSKEYQAVPCVALSMLADDGIVASCEGDVMNTVSMMILKIISGNTVTYGDAINHVGNTVKFSACGFLPFSMGCGKRCVQKFMDHPGFNGIQTSFVMRPEKVTYMRLVEDIGKYHIIYGTGNGLETELRDGCMPALDVHLDGLVEDLVKNYAGQHYAITYGDYSETIKSFADLMGITALRI